MKCLQDVRLSAQWFGLWLRISGEGFERYGLVEQKSVGGLGLSGLGLLRGSWDLVTRVIHKVSRTIITYSPN